MTDKPANIRRIDSAGRDVTDLPGLWGEEDVYKKVNTMDQPSGMTLYELVNPSDPYTFYAPSVEVAGVCAVLLSTGFGANPVSGEGERTPVMFGWNEWLEAKGIDGKWIEAHRDQLADAYETFLIGDASKRSDVESMLAMLPEEKREEWRDQRQDRHRTSLSKIGEAAYAKAKRLRSKPV